MSRYKAFLIHLSISLLVFSGLAGVLLYWWYPGLFFDTDGGWQGVRIIALVDLVLGPCLTLVVFKAGKPGLALDLFLIAMFQTICLSAGVWVVYSERPLAMVMVDDIFYTVSRDDYLEAQVSLPDLSGFEGIGPRWVTVDLPDDINLEGEIRKRSLSTDRPLRILHERYVPFAVDQLDPARAIPYSDLLKQDAETKAIPAWLQVHGGVLEDYHFYLFGARYRLIHLGVNFKTGKVVGVLQTPAPK